MIEKDIHVNEQYKVYQQLHEMRYWYTKEEIQDMVARDACRKSEIYITKCMVSQNWRDPFVLVMNNVGEVNLIIWEKRFEVGLTSRA